MAGMPAVRNVPAFLMVAIYILAQNVAQGENHPPEIRLGIPYSERRGVVRLSEDTPLMSLLVIVDPRDEDTGPEGEVKCSVDNEYVRLSSEVPKVYKVELAKALDRETDPLFEVHIMCSDKGRPSMTSTATFTIDVVDVNDNAPSFSKGEYKATLPENVPIGTFVVRVKATDRDAGDNGRVEYSLPQTSEDEYSPFRIDANTGKIYTDVDIDRESVNEHKLIVLATDSGRPQMSSTVEVTIEVEDINDNAPVILNKELHTRENQKAMSLVGAVKAMDLDAGKNAELVFAKIEDDLTSSTTPFLVEPNGNILAVVSLDREQRSQYVMAVLVRDSGEPPQSSSSTITIIVDDVNDNVPIFTSSCLHDGEEYEDYNDNGHYDDHDTFSILRNSSTSGFISIDWYTPDDNRIIGQAEATDSDSGDNARLVYSIESVVTGDALNITSKDDLLFAIDEDTGEIFLRRAVLPSEDLVQIVYVVASDQGNPSHSSMCALNISIDVDPTLLTTPITTQDMIKYEVTETGGPGNGSPLFTAGRVSSTRLFTTVLSLLIFYWSVIYSS